MFGGRYTGWAQCPECGFRLHLSDADQHGLLTCTHCGKPSIITHPYWSAVLLFSFVAAWAFPYFLGLRGRSLPYLVFAWIPLFLLLIIIVGNATAALSPPVLRLFRPQQQGIARQISTFFAFWFASWFLGIFYYLDLFGSLMVLLGGSQREISEHLEFLSTPLGWADSSFVIHPQMDFLKVCGIVGFNSFFYAAILFAAFTIVHGFLNRAKPVQLGLSGTSPGDDDEDS